MRSHLLLAYLAQHLLKEEVRRRVLEQFPDIGAKESRTWGEAGTDVLASLGKGFGQLAQFPGQVGLQTGIVAPSELDTGLYGMGKRLEAYAEEQKSPVLKAKEALRGQKIQPSLS